MRDFNYATHSKPINRSAADAMSGGTNYELPESYRIQSVPFETKPHPDPSADLTGKKIGRMTVVGFMYSKKGKRGFYSCRCVCGNYQIVRSKRIRSSLEDGHNDMCDHCKHVEKLKRGKAA